MFKNFLKNKAKVIEDTDPDRIYVENIRSFFNIPTRWAKYLCEVAVKQRIFRKKVAVLCKNDQRIIEIYDSKDQIPEIVNCLVCEIEGKKHSFNRDELETIEFYQLIEKE